MSKLLKLLIKLFNPSLSNISSLKRVLLIVSWDMVLAIALYIAAVLVAIAYAVSKGSEEELRGES